MGLVPYPYYVGSIVYIKISSFVFNVGLTSFTRFLVAPIVYSSLVRVSMHLFWREAYASVG